MSTRIDKAFSQARVSQRKAFVPFTVLGYPDAESSFQTIKTLIEGGATALELGLPFSDPMADGPIIENASKAVVGNGFTTGDAMSLTARIRRDYEEIPIIVMSYFNLAFVRGIEQFMRDLKEAGVDGVTFVDLPPEEGESVFRAARHNQIATVMLVSPTTAEKRMEQILRHAQGYVYVVSRAGITGLCDHYDEKLRSLIETLREKTELPICVGFGISKPEHVTRMLDLGADGIVVGSKIVELQHHGHLSAVVELVEELTGALETLDGRFLELPIKTSS